MIIVSHYQTAPTDASDHIPARYGHTAGTAVSVDTGLTVSIPVMLLPSFQFLELEPMELTPIQEEVTPFSEEELLKLLRPNSLTTPLLADIWRDDVNDERVDS
jgi:hypothetical protein